MKINRLVAITHICHIDKEPTDVFRNLVEIEALSNWWTKETSGTSTLGGELIFKFGDRFINKMKVTGYENDKFVEWTVIDAISDWMNTKISFSLDKNEGKTRVRFRHDGFEEQDDFFAHCSFSWARYLMSLRSLTETGTGNPFEG